MAKPDKNHFLRCWNGPSEKWTLDSLYEVSFFLSWALSLDLPFSFAWSTAVLSGLGLLIASWGVDKLKEQACRAVAPALAACFEPLAHFWKATSLSLFYSYFFGNFSSQLAEFAALASSSWRSTQYSYKLFFFRSLFLDVMKMFLVVLSFLLQILEFFARRMLFFVWWSKWL